jgi:hypothetical protein
MLSLRFYGWTDPLLARTGKKSILLVAHVYRNHGNRLHSVGVYQRAAKMSQLAEGLQVVLESAYDGDR